MYLRTVAALTALGFLLPLSLSCRSQAAAGTAVKEAASRSDAGPRKK